MHDLTPLHLFNSQPNGHSDALPQRAVWSPREKTKEKRFVFHVAISHAPVKIRVRFLCSFLLSLLCLFSLSVSHRFRTDCGGVVVVVVC